MYLIILSKDSKKLLFSTYDQSSFHKIIKNNIDEMIYSGKNYEELEDFHFSIYVTKDLIYAAIEPYDGYRIRYDKFRKEKSNKKQLIKFVLDINNVISSEDRVLLLSEDPSKLITEKISNKEFILNHLKNNLIFKRLTSILVPYKNEIRLIGEDNSGISSIFYTLFGLTISSQYQDCQIPLMKDKIGEPFKFKKFNIPRGYPGFNDVIIPKEKFLFYIIDSTNKSHLRMNTSIKNTINNAKIDQKLLIIANKQDLPNAMPPEEVEKKMGYSTVGFSTIASDAPERLEQILTEFLKDWVNGETMQGQFVWVDADVIGQ